MMTSGVGIVGDIAAPAERGGFFGLYGLGALRMCMWSFLREVSKELGC